MSDKNWAHAFWRMAERLHWVNLSSCKAKQRSDGQVYLLPRPKGAGKSWVHCFGCGQPNFPEVLEARLLDYKDRVQALELECIRQRGRADSAELDVRRQAAALDRIRTGKTPTPAKKYEQPVVYDNSYARCEDHRGPYLDGHSYCKECTSSWWRRPEKVTTVEAFVEHPLINFKTCRGHEGPMLKGWHYECEQCGAQWLVA